VNAPIETRVPKAARRLKLSKVWIWTLLSVILVLAGGLRFYGLRSTPPALYLDEAADGANAIQALENGHFQVFYPEDGGREGLYINVASVFIHFLGSTSLALRLPAALFGLLTVGGVYALTAELLSPPAGLAAAFFLATSYWHLNFSRIAFRAIGAPLFLVWALYLLLLAFRRVREGRDFALQAALAGVIYGLGFYTYIAYRITPVLVVLALTFFFVEASRFGWIRRYWIAAGLFAAGTVVILYPLVAYLVSHPGDAMKRVNAVSVFRRADPAREIFINSWRTFGMLYWKGDQNLRHNYRGRPEVFWPVALLMTLGVGLAIRRVLTRRSPTVLLPPALLLVWIFCGAIPAILSDEGMPHALRSILMLPPIAILAAMGATKILSSVPARVPTSMLMVAAIAVACALTGETIYVYFHEWAADPGLPEQFDGGNVRTALQINSLPKDREKVVAVERLDVSDPFSMSLVALRYLTNSVTLKQQTQSHIRYYSPHTFPLRLTPGPGDFCAQVRIAMPQAIVVCPGF